MLKCLVVSIIITTFAPIFIASVLENRDKTFNNNLKTKTLCNFQHSRTQLLAK